MPDDLQIRLSGGINNTNPQLSLGGGISNTLMARTNTAFDTTSPPSFALEQADGFVNTSQFQLVLTKDFGGAGNVGIQLKDLVTTDLGQVVLLLDGVLSMASSVAFPVTSTDEYAFQNFYISDGTNFYNNLSAGVSYFDINVSNPLQNLFANITKDESKVGKDVYRAVFVYNNSGATKFYDLVLSLAQDNDPDLISIGLDPAGGINFTVTTNGITPPDTIVFSTPTKAEPLIMPTVQTGSSIALWFKTSLAALNILSAFPAAFKVQIDLSVGDV